LRILVNDFGGYAFPAQLSRELARRGHTVLHTHCRSNASGKGPLDRNAQDPDTLAFDALDLGQPFARHSMVRRLRQERQYGRMIVDRARAFGPDVVISANMPLFAQREVLSWTRGANRAFVYWQQDVISVAMGAELQRRVPVAGALGALYLGRLERQMLTSSDFVVTISPDFRPTLENWGVRPERIRVVENWAPLADLPATPRRNHWAEEHNLVEPFVFLYAGTLGLKHDPELLLHLAAGVEEFGGVLVVISEGSGADFVTRRAHEQGLANVRVLPFQPYDRLPQILATADVLVAILEPGAGVFSVPSKILSYFCASRPILAAIPSENLAARTIVRANAGIVVDPKDPSSFVASGISLLRNETMRSAAAESARQYAQVHFDILAIGDRVEAVLTAASHPSH